MGRGTAPVRIDPDLYESARAVGAAEHRSAAQQVAVWIRLGRAVSMPATAVGQRISAAVAGEVPLGQLVDEERCVADATIDVAIEQAAESVPLGEQLAAEGVTTVALDDEGRLVEYRPDGTTAVVG
ncbi:MAG: hypothetical protein WEB09_10870 [Nitriliruptor sp.]